MSTSIFQDIKLFSSSDIAGIVSMGDAINAMEQAFSSFSAGTSHVPQRSIVSMNNMDLFLKPAYNEDLGKIAVKIITQKKDRNIQGIPAILGVVLLVDIKTGAIVAMMDGAYITALRTGAAAGVATKLAAPENAETVALFGCGAQGRRILEAVCNVRKIKRAFLFDLSNDKTHQFRDEMENRLGITLIADMKHKNLKDADIICTATSSERPLFTISDIPEGVHINAIGSYRPEMQELDPSVILKGKLFVDSRQSVLKESGDLIKPIAENIFNESVIEAEIGDLINRKSLIRSDDNEITIFKSVGLGVQDLFMANMIFEKYLNG